MYASRRASSSGGMRTPIIGFMPVGAGPRFFFCANRVSCLTIRTMLAQIRTGQEVESLAQRARRSPGKTVTVGGVTVKVRAFKR
jgi:hypothetical protein